MDILKVTTNPDTVKLERRYAECGFYVVAKVFECWVDFTIYDIECYRDDKHMFHKKGSHCFPDPVPTVEESEPYIHGSVKFDGCSNWNFDEQDRSMLHGCGRQDVLRFGQILAECWDWTKELLPNVWSE